jgi:hypothetical protein
MKSFERPGLPVLRVLRRPSQGASSVRSMSALEHFTDKSRASR